jgi:predicted phosphodiesterase
MLRSALLIGDIHAEDELLEAALAFAPRAERVLSVGDIVDGVGDLVRCIDLLRAHDADVVSGNHERWVRQGQPFLPFAYSDDALAWIDALPPTREYQTPTGRLMLCHGVGDHDMVSFKPDMTGYALECLDEVWDLVHAGEHRWIAGGHTHVPMVRTLEGVTFLNPGTLVLDQEPGFMLANFETGIIEHWTLLPRPTLLHSHEVPR